MKKTAEITNDLIQNAMTYEAYRDLINKLLKEDKVTGDFMKNGKWILNYTKGNNLRMDRGAKVFKANQELSDIVTGVKDNWIWLVITEGWCGDAAQIIPGFVQLAALNPNHTIRFILRDEHPAVMDNYLTNGSRSIPILVLLKEDTLEEIGYWGPRPAVAQKMTMDFKEEENKDMDKYITKLHKWYDENLFEDIQNELLAKLKSWT